MDKGRQGIFHVDVEFLAPDEAWPRLRAASFWSTVQPAEMVARYGVRRRGQAWARLRRAVQRPFAADERRVLERVCRDAHELWRRAFDAPLQQPFRLIRLEGPLDWEYPYTVGDAIVLPARAIPRISPTTLLHEALHVLQRGSPDAFAAWYRDWGFRRLDRPLHVPPGIRARWVSNPDGWDNHRWVWGEGHRAWCLVCELGPQGAPVARGYRVDEPRAALVEEGSVSEAYLAERFGPLGQLYHPHEILARRLERWLTDGRVPEPWRARLGNCPSPPQQAEQGASNVTPK